MKEKSIVGDLINFRRLVHSPINENGTIFLFGKVAQDLSMYVEEIKPGFPDSVARRFTGKGCGRIFVEFEHSSLNFKDHKHDHRDCDLIMSSEHNWADCPIEVIEREKSSNRCQTRESRGQRLSEAGEHSFDEHLAQSPAKVQKLFQEFNRKVSEISENVWRKCTKVVTYYAPERVFIS